MESTEDTGGVTKSEPVDRWLGLPMLLLVGFPLALVACWAGPFGLAFAGAPILFLLWAAAVIAGAVCVLLWAVERHWRRAISWLVFLVATWTAAMNFDAVWTGAITAGDTVHFWVMRPSYLAELAKLPADKGARFFYVNWGGFVVSHLLVYDESDEIALPADCQSDDWKKKIAGSELACGITAVAPFGDHFYDVRTGC